MRNEEIIKAVKNSLNIYSFTAEALEMLIDNVKKEATVRTKDLTDDEIASIGSELAAKNCVSDIAFARAVIAADREKNK